MLAKVVTRNANYLKVKLASNKHFVEPKVFSYKETSLVKCVAQPF